MKPAIHVVIAPPIQISRRFYVSDFLATSDGLNLTKAFVRITDAKLRRCIVDLVEEIACN